MSAEPKGCLTALLSLVGIKLGGTTKSIDELPYRLRDDFLSAAELSFYQVLCTALGNHAIVCPKVNLADIFFVVRPNENQAYRNKIDRKHVDFLICDPTTMKPRCGVELDDSSHTRRDRQQRDEFVGDVFEAVDLPLVRIPARASYGVSEILALIEPHLVGEPLRPAIAVSGTTTCPKCGVPMVKRMAKKGQNAGKAFYGCPNFPRCKEIASG